MKNKAKLVPPDGGWGWFVVLGSSIMQLSTRSIEPCFGLLFGDIFKDLGIATTGAAVIVSAFDAIINFSGLFVGPLIKKYSYRTVGFMGAFLSATGLISTAYVGSMAHILLTYSIICGIGFGLTQASLYVALNSYFLKRRGQAVGLAMAGTGLGFMAFPQLINILMEEYGGFHNTMLLIGALSLNALVGASLLQPVEWHIKPTESSQNVKKVLDEEDNNASKSLLGIIQDNSDSNFVQQNKESSNVAKSSILLYSRSMSSLVNPRNRKSSTISYVSNLDLVGSTMHVQLETDSENEYTDCEWQNNKIENGMRHNGCHNLNNNAVMEPDVQKSQGGCWSKFSALMDLDLLLDVRYLNILFGLSIAYVAELNFKMIIPFFLGDLGFSKREVAKVLSLMAIADIIARIVTPLISDRLSYSRRNTFLVALIFVSVARSVAAEQTSLTIIVISMMFHGFFRGVILINFPLVVSEAVIQEKFPPAYGLSMVAKGIFVVAFGPVSGWFRDYTQSYSLSLHLQSAMMASCIIAWLIEYFISFSMKKTRETNIELT